MEGFFTPLCCVQNDRLHCHPDARRNLIEVNSVLNDNFLLSRDSSRRCAAFRMTDYIFIPT